MQLRASYSIGDQMKGVISFELEVECESLEQELAQGKQIIMMLELLN
jgi:hypothetical protein